jgi:hypothetical protein
MMKVTHPAATELSLARHRLADLQLRRSDKLAALDAEAGHSNRLNAFHEAIEPARAALAAFDAQQALAMSNWARGNVNGKSATPSAHREALARDLADAEQNSAAAKVAQADFQANAERFAGDIRGLDEQIREAVKIVAIEEATLLLPSIAGAVASFADLHASLDAAIAVVDDFEFGSTQHPEARAAMVKLIEARNIAEALPIIRDTHGEGWRRFSAALERDASIDFEGAQRMAVQPTPFEPTAVDPVIAAMTAAASFSTTSIVR